MSVSIILDRPGVYTNLDYVSGHVLLRLSYDETILSVIVKLEGISRTRIQHPQGEDHERESKRAEVEEHKLMYITQTVWPDPGISNLQSSSNQGYKIKAGEHTYPFNFRIPINNDCQPNTGLLSKLSFDKGVLDIAKTATKHIRTTLPPSLSGIQEDAAKIWYYLKVTVARPNILKQNLRSLESLVLLPFEPPRPPRSDQELFAKRQHQFNYQPPAKKSGVLDSIFNKKGKIVQQSAQPRFSIETRFPNPAIVVPNEQLPMRIILTKNEPYTIPIIIKSIQIRLFSTTYLAAHEQYKNIVTATPVVELNSLHIVLGDANTPVGAELEVDRRVWGAASLPDSTPPSFRTCNIARAYQLQVVIGLSPAGNGPVDMIPLVTDIQVYSGIIPPLQLLAAANQKPPKLANLSPLSTARPVKQPGMYATTPIVEKPHAPHWNAPEPHVDPNSAPPTYDEAVAAQIDPVNGPRRQYQQDPAYFQTEDSEKRSGVV